MIEKIIKAVKRGNKRRGRNITIGAVIGFLLSCTAVMGVEEIGLEITQKADEEIKFNGSEYDKDKHKFSDNTFEDGTYINNMTISAENDSGEAFGIKLSLTDKTINIINNGTILGNSSNSGYGHGICIDGGTIKILTNNGLISGSSSSSLSGYGIYNKGGTITTLTNNGLISGSSSSSLSGYGICNREGSTITILTNNGLISGSGSSHGYGIFNYISTIVTLINNGLISGSNSENKAVSAGYGIYQYMGSTITTLTNNGIISGSGVSSGYGIYNEDGSYDNSGMIATLTNNGLISGSGSLYGYGIDNNNYGTITTLTNNGLISASGSDCGYGIQNHSASTITTLTNNGLIYGYSSDTNPSSGSPGGYGIYESIGTITTLTNNGIISGSGSYKGYGIYILSGTIETLNNTGVIYGKDNAINKNEYGTITTAKNNGILVNGDDGKGVVDGLDIVDETPKENEILNKGLIFTAVDGGVYKAAADDYQKFGQTFNDSGITIINAKAIDEELSVIDTEKNITGTESLKLKNGTLSYNDSKNNSKVENISSSKGYILNGITNTLEVSGKNNELNDSVINAYKTAVVMGSNDSTLILNNTVVNGGILGNDPTIRITGNKNILTIQGNSVVNGTMESTGENNTLNFTGNDENGINIMHKISGFSNMNIGENTNVTLFEKTIGAKGEETALEVSGVKEIDIKAGGVLNLRIGSQKSTDGRYEGHALFGNIGLKINGDISQLPDGKTEIEEIEGEKYNVGVFNLVTNGLGINSIIAMDGITLNENLFVKTNSILDKATIIKNPSENEKEGDIKIEGKQDIFEMYVDKSKRYIKLNEIYKGIYSSEAENFNALKDILTLSGAGGDYTSVTYKDQLARLLSYLSNIYTETPYSFSSELSRKSMGMFRDIITENQFKPNLNQWLIMGGLTHRDGGTKDSYYGKNYHGFDTGTSDVDVDMKLTGAYALGKYGYSENVSLGVTAGGNRSEAKLPMSKVKGNSGYIGAFAENYRGNLTLKAGAGIQYSEYDADRGTFGGHSYSDKYSDMTYDIYLSGRYSYNIGENLFLEPYGTLSYTYVDQEGTDEGNKVLAIETDSKSFDYTAAKVGVDLKKVIPHEKGKSTLSAGVSYTRLLTGADEENITGRFKGENATDFDILVAHKNEHSIGLNAKYALELESGILFDVKGSYSLERDSHNGTGKNRNKGEWIVGAGLGYKF
ncbi:autotransporter domain-containing protein [Fusobacterium varium]